jgi:hypothetical protein
MLTYNPGTRITAMEAYSHKWLEGKSFNRLSPENAEELAVNIRQFCVLVYVFLIVF